MKRPSKIVLLSLAGFIAVGGFLWMRSLASWRPAKLGHLLMADSPSYITSDGQSIVTERSGATNVLHVVTSDFGSSKLTVWPQMARIATTSPPVTGRCEPYYWVLRPSQKSSVEGFELRDEKTGVVRYNLPWKIRADDSEPLVQISDDKKTLRVLSCLSFQEFNIATEKVERRVSLQKPLRNGDENGFVTLMISRADNKLYGCLGRSGRIWEATTGRLIKSWTLDKEVTGTPNPDFLGFHTMIYTPAGTSNTHTLEFVDAETGKLRWKITLNNKQSSFLSEDEDEVLIPQSNGCEVRRTSTGQVLRQLPGPNRDESTISVTRDWIYSLNSKNNILRWRAR